MARKLAKELTAGGVGSKIEREWDSAIKHHSLGEILHAIGPIAEGKVTEPEAIQRRIQKAYARAKNIDTTMKVLDGLFRSLKKLLDKEAKKEK